MLPVQQFKKFIHDNALFNVHHRVLLAVSGGKDSVLMAQLFKLAGFDFSIAHCNFNLRADESQRDEAFVRMLASTLEVKFYVTHFDTKAYAQEHQLSTQMAARELRYQWFEQIRQAHNYAAIAVAHHQNDSIETLLLNLTRGTGISGLHGILPKRDHLVRPLLFLSRQQIDELLEVNHIDFVEDSSNETSKYARNKIRLNVIPHLQEINPNLEETFVQNIQRFAATEEVLQQVVNQKRNEIFRVKDDGIYLSIDKINELKPQFLLLYELLKPYHFSSAVVNEILLALTKQSGTSFYSHSHRATINREDIMISALPTPMQHEAILMHPKDEIVVINNQAISLRYTAAGLIDYAASKAFVPVEKLIFPLIIRFRQDGDKFIPLGMKQHKKLSDFLIDSKVPLPQKEKIPLLINGNGEMIWVAGLRLDNRYKVNATTKKVAIFELFTVKNN